MKAVIERTRDVIFFFLYLGIFLFGILIGFSAESFWQGFLIIAIGWLIIDILNLALSYIFTGTLDINRSIYCLMFHSHKNKNTAQAEVSKEAVEKVVSEKILGVLPYVSKFKSPQIIARIYELDRIGSAQLERSSKILEEIYKKTGKDDDYFFSQKGYETLDTETLEAHSTAKIETWESKAYQDYFALVMGSMININHKLDKGLSLEKGYSLLKKEEGKSYKIFTKRMSEIAHYYALSQVIVKNKRAGKTYDVKVFGDEIIEFMKPYFLKHCSLIESTMLGAKKD